MPVGGRVKLSEAAKLIGSFRNTQRHSYAGKSTIVSETGRRFVSIAWLKTRIGDAPAAGSRESSSENKAALASQTEGLRQFADLMEDLVAILTSFSARLYGQRRGRKKTEAAIKTIKTA